MKRDDECVVLTARDTPCPVAVCVIFCGELPGKNEFSIVPLGFFLAFSPYFFVLLL